MTATLDQGRGLVDDQVVEAADPGAVGGPADHVGGDRGGDELEGRDEQELGAVAAVVHVLVMPRIRFRVHRWEVTDTAVHTRAGWIGRESRIAPISRVQTVDSRQGALMRLFGLSSITVTTASAAGPITVDCLDADTARQVVARLTAITAATEDDAT